MTASKVTIHDNGQVSIKASDRSKAYKSLRSDFAGKIVATLRIMTADSSATFITGADLANEIVKRCSAANLSKDEMEDLKNNVCTNLCQMFNNKMRTNVFRSNHRLVPNIGGKMSYGYRYGAPIAVPYRDTQEIEREKSATAGIVVSHENFDTIFSDAIKNKSFGKLQEYMLIIASEIEERHNATLIRNHEMSQEIESLKLKNSAILEQTSSLAKSVHQIVEDTPASRARSITKLSAQHDEKNKA